MDTVPRTAVNGQRRGCVGGPDPAGRRRHRKAVVPGVLGVDGLREPGEATRTPGNEDDGSVASWERSCPEAVPRATARSHCCEFHWGSEWSSSQARCPGASELCLTVHHQLPVASSRPPTAFHGIRCDTRLSLKNINFAILPRYFFNSNKISEIPFITGSPHLRQELGLWPRAEGLVSSCRLESPQHHHLCECTCVMTVSRPSVFSHRL